MTFKKFLPQKFTNRIILLIGFLGVITAAVNTSFTIYTNYKNTYEKVFNSIEIQYDIFADDFAEAMLLEDIYSIYSEVNEINKSFGFISNIYVLDAKGEYFTDANATRKIPDNISEDITVNKAIKAGETTIGKIIFVLNKNEIQKGIFSDVSRLVFVNIFIVIMGVLLGIVLARFLSNPLKQLSYQISNINPLKIPEELHTPAFSSYEVEQLKNTLHDLSYRLKESISQIKQQQREINKAERLASIGTMAAGLAHELKNPIMSLKLISDALQKEYADRDFNLKKDMEMISRQSDRLVKRINTFLAYAKPIESKIIEINIPEFVKYLKDLFSKYMDNVYIEYNYHSTENFKTDAEMLAQVLENLVQNSYEAGAENITISFYFENNRFIIKYFDNGTGLETSDKNEIFRPFFTTKESGTGLGLAMCEKILENLGGSISVIDTNCGAGFFIEINLNGL
ncbi:MAG: HAMP domain-containing histidine kinase [Flexistipes sinusarabici]|uniref:histidine kinase n=1 Tax=Flexistipes sinusarabici TaxID=2352 RepID=A0A5D0MQ11_FLESI|nr:HAMP domain-containing sensor histidine kinase [Flexistipes sinusarabici]TYB35216.1 MAG: HAMP domain-containing histidine kinase [Flexistipes sinusarabici]